ncbi:unnamed protein product [Cuscuta campestris]|uniref:Homeobox domain-containing protein n=1 Tax=Cuscuta campestris TaxID=132261 RepID=A0A484L8T1_9ASTE|nr:unnamed protein product [Cuscuta campestris]
MGRISREEGYESRSGSENFEGASGEDQDPATDKKSSKRKKYHRHTPYQIQELESAFKDNPHLEEKARLELGRRLNLESKQVKFWFQNKRTQMKAQLERHENAILKQENDKLRIENIAMKEAMNSPICNQCGGQAMLGDVHVEEHHLRIENARLRDELNRICVLANKFLGKPFLPLTNPIGDSGLELAVGRSNFGGMTPGVDASMPLGLDFGLEASYDKSMLMELGFTAMNELLKLAEAGEPLWFRSLDGNGEALNLEEYERSFHCCIGMRGPNFITEATRTTGTVMFNCMAIVETLMDADRWAEMFTGIVGRASTVDVISSNSSGSRNGSLQLMQAELQILSPLVPLHNVKFLRFCKHHAEGVWAIVDVSVDGSHPHEFQSCRMLPSGCIVQDLLNGYSKVIWIQHMEYDESGVHNFFRALIRSGLGLGAQRWLATLQRQCECLDVIMSSSSIPTPESSAISPSGRRSIASLAQRMTRSFCAVVCANIYKWDAIQTGSGDDPAAARLNMRHSAGEPGDSPGVVLSATKTIWLPIARPHLFDFLRNEETRSQWDALSNHTLQQIIHIPKGRNDSSNLISLYCNTASANVSQNRTLILQESCSDASGSIITYTSVGAQEMTVVMNGGDSSSVALLPSGFSIVSDCFDNSGWPDQSKGTLSDRGGNNGGTGSLLTIGVQMLVSSSPGAKLTMESVQTVNTLISRMVLDIKAAFHCN